MTSLTCKIFRSWASISSSRCLPALPICFFVSLCSSSFRGWEGRSGVSEGVSGVSEGVSGVSEGRSGVSGGVSEVSEGVFGVSEGRSVVSGGYPRLARGDTMTSLSPLL